MTSPLCRSHAISYSPPYISHYHVGRLSVSLGSWARPVIIASGAMELLRALPSRIHPIPSNLRDFSTPASR
ncbi:hypothetical protein BM1_03075 [Bipolaris maydis]|nr:hypothetical protein BM1_03075 [Bipolaris maydis]